MGSMVTQLYRRIDESRAYCFNVESSQPLTDREIECLRLVLADGFLLETVLLSPVLQGDRVVEVGPRLNFATAWSSNMVSICRATGIDCVTRVERSRRYLVPDGQDIHAFIASHHDRMTECPYSEPLHTFETGIVPEAVYDVDLKTDGPDALLGIPGISMDEWDRNFYYDYFVTKHKRNPTIVEIMDLNNANSEHSRHGFFKGKQIIDGQEQEQTLFELVIDTLTASPKGSLIAFKDNSSVVEGYDIKTLHPSLPGEPSAFGVRDVRYHPLLTAETHNFPTGVAPFPGAETGTGGRIRDVQGTGKGGFVIAGTAGYCVGNLHIPGYALSWENHYPCPDNLASALQIEIDASNGASDYGNKFGEPLIQGFTRSFDLRLADGERWGYLKPIMFTAGVGQIDDRHTKKEKEQKGMIIVQVGGPAYRVGFGGGAASSMLQGENASELDFNAVQRGDAEMEQKMNRVIRACNEMGDKTLIDVIHDQGAGGPANVLKELVEKSGGRVEIRNIRVGDPTMSVLEIYVAEYQERNGFLIRPENIEQFQTICAREKVGCEVLGEVTGDLRFVLHDATDDSTPVDIELDILLGNIPQKTFTDERRDPGLHALALPQDLSVAQALHDVLRLLSVGSKRFLTNKVDRAVSGLIVRQQCCGPLQLTVSDVAVVAQSHFGLTGIATAIGEQPIKMLVNPAAGARMAVGESLTNLVWAGIEDLEQVKCSANWMWAPKLPGEGAAIYDAAKAMRDAMVAIGIAVDGGKDSLSMATMVAGETVKSPRQLVISVYAAVPDIRQVVTPDIKEPGSVLVFIDLSKGKNRLGGTALAQVQGQIGNESPDMDDPLQFKQAFGAVQELIRRGLILSGHDRSDGGLITTLLEMTFSGNCGLDIDLASSDSPLAALFSEELGLVVECRQDDLDVIAALLIVSDIPHSVIGRSTIVKQIRVRCNGELVLDEKMQTLRGWWEESSYQLERLQMNPLCAEEEKENIADRQGPLYHLSFTPELTPAHILEKMEKPKVAILRDEGSNSDREMTSAFYAAGFEPWDICMNDLLAGRITLDGFRGLAAVGGFSYADVPESAKGWAATILFNEQLKTMFNEFYNRPDTFTLGVCNGCQLFGLLGWVPWLGIEPAGQPRFAHNTSGRFESRWVTVKVQPSKSIMFKGMEDLVFGIHLDHGEGRLHFPDAGIRQQVEAGRMTPMVYVDDSGQATEAYPFNPNGSPDGLAALCSPDGRHLALMPHPERAFLPWQLHYLPESMKDIQASPWLKMFQNAYTWCGGE
ncbi:MAG: phosphoribosylformylglycinamidine synthase [Proteobacteria bacterium]|nr:phosphoribosylformylglycinamidine synthase [Desulfocapsa sp.]MBU3945907.1 phosphoribosylformylglycinamidine synthase [Pseudomonadota bacterium]MCG2744800.1 phosphoribosylformylglycinamidine synthase [Desulfobacteraceae bacterium]MBU3982040.1 phosphoribosylformylglycinamidine synthase [Pseudomonadota bacterium]MBU4028863.1 phosphoribosylformylglycinamidine synthase [Pseudomonadota bacterium]